jgi:uncharacterized membrane protein
MPAVNPLASALSLLPALDWAAVALFFAAWIGYAVWAKRRGAASPTLLAVTNEERRRWMLQTSMRDNRVLDAIVTQNLSISPQFFASTTILIIGGLLAVLSTTEQASELVAEIPFAARTSALVFDLKVALLTAIFIYAFFRFTWSLRQYSVGVLLVASAPDHQQMAGDEAARQAFADRAGRVMSLAAETFNDGLRAYYMAFAASAWFFSAWAMLVATAAVVAVLYHREFGSQMLAALRG